MEREEPTEVTLSLRFERLPVAAKDLALATPISKPPLMGILLRQVDDDEVRFPFWNHFSLFDLGTPLEEEFRFSLWISRASSWVLPPRLLPPRCVVFPAINPPASSDALRRASLIERHVGLFEAMGRDVSMWMGF